MSIMLFCFLTSLAILGLRLSAEEGQLLSIATHPFKSGWLAYVGKPLITCARCMASVWGVLSYLFWFNEVNIIEMIFCVCVISFLNSFLYALYYRL